MSKKSKLVFFKKISVRIPLILLIILLIGIGLTVTYFAISQNDTVIMTRQKAIEEEGEILFISIKNSMLGGEAPLVVDLFRDFNRSDFVSDIKLYRADGALAFSDNKTLHEVNRNLGVDKFQPKTRFFTGNSAAEKPFIESVNNVKDILVESFIKNNEKIISYKPLINQPKCSSCHGLDHTIRGVIKVTSPLSREFETTRQNIYMSIIQYVLVVLFLTVIIILFIHNVVIKRILKIGVAVNRVSEGDFKTKLNFPPGDEIGVLSGQIDKMIDGLYERFKLSKFVSKSTLDHVQSEDQISLGGTVQRLTVLFSDIRQFTSFSEKHSPEKVMEVLNEVMMLQSDIIASHNGDIDKYVGDEIMAVFTGEDMVKNALRAAEEIRNKMGEKSAVVDSVHVGIGINTGEAIVGNMGSSLRLDRTVIGDSINLGARLCSVAGKNTIVISESVYKEARDYINAREHKPIKVKGKEKPVKIYTLRKVL